MGEKVHQVLKYFPHNICSCINKSSYQYLLNLSTANLQYTNMNTLQTMSPLTALAFTLVLLFDAMLCHVQGERKPKLNVIMSMENNWRRSQFNDQWTAPFNTSQKKFWTSITQTRKCMTLSIWLCYLLLWRHIQYFCQ